MRNLSSKSPPVPMAKIAVKKKEKVKAPSKKVKDSKLTPRFNHCTKATKCSERKTKAKQKDARFKKTEKNTTTVGRKKNECPKNNRKCLKEPKLEKKTKSATETTRKRKITPSNHIFKTTNDCVTPVKMAKLLTSPCAQTKFNSSNSKIMPQTTRNPWVLKLDLSSKPSSTMTNGVSNNSALPMCNKSVIFFPKRNAAAVSGVIFNTNPVPVPRKEVAPNEHYAKSSKTTLCKESSTEKETLRKVNNLITPFKAFEPFRRTDNKQLNNSKDCKLSSSSNVSKLLNESKLSACKDQKISKLLPFRDEKLKDQKSMNSKDPKLLNFKDLRLINIKSEKDLNSKNSQEQSPESPKDQKPIIVRDLFPVKDQQTMNSESQKVSNSHDQKFPEQTFSNFVKHKPATITSQKALTLKEQKFVVPKEHPKIHPQRMASLDAMAKMHVICTTDRRSQDSSRTAESTKSSDSSPKKIGGGGAIQFNEKGQFNFGKIKNDSGLFNNELLSFIKVENTAVSEEPEDTNFLNSFMQFQPLKRPRGRPRLYPLPVSKDTNAEKPKKSKPDINNNKKTVRKRTFKESSPPPQKVVIKKEPKEPVQKQCSRMSVKKEITTVKSKAKKAKDAKCKNKPTKSKVEATNSKVKVKETIRMQKTCTYQSVTTVNSHETEKSVVNPCNQVGVTTNYSETKKTVVTDTACHKDKPNFTIEEVHQGQYCGTTESPCSSPKNSSDCYCSCVTHSSPSLIPLAHAQPCRGMPRHGDTPHCGVHRFGHQQHLIYPHSARGCSCCCSNALLQPVPDSCLLQKGINSCSHHLPTCGHFPSSFTPKLPCAVCSHDNSSVKDNRQQTQFLPSSSPVQSSLCSFCESCHESNQLTPVASSCHRCPAANVSSKNVNAVPCDQTPLDLSVAANPSTSISQLKGTQPQGHCLGSLCCRDVMLFQSSSHNFQPQHSHINKLCCACSLNGHHQSHKFEKPQMMQLTANKAHKTVKVVRMQQTTGSLPLFTSISTSRASSTVVSVTKASTEGSILCQEGSMSQAENFANHMNRQEKMLVPRPLPRLSSGKKRKFVHGWNWEGDPKERLIALTNDSIPCPKKCYPAMRHKEGDIISERDCVLLRSGPKDTDLPYVAKIAAFWENPDDGEMMMSLLWYYRPEHTDQGRKPGQMEDEVFASKHKDINSVACIDDKCYVLTFAEYCRYRANLAMSDITTISQAAATVPEPVNGYPRRHRLPPIYVSPDMVFCCRSVYDFRQKRILKNPT